MTNQSEPQGVFHAADLPLSWMPLGQCPPAQAEQWQHQGVALLRALSVIEMPVSELDRDTASAAGKAMERLEAKLDLALSLMMQLAAREQIGLPPVCAVILRADSAEWIDQSAPEAGQMLLISLHISPKLPQPLTLPARVTATERREQGTRVKADFIHLNEELADWLERTLFRFHRRSIQQGHARQRGEA